MLSALHPSSIIDGLHFQCTSAVEQQNKLKAAQASSQPSPVLSPSDKKKSGSKEQRRFGKKHQPRDTGPEKVAQDVEASDVEEGKCQMSRLQVMLSLSKVYCQIKCITVAWWCNSYGISLVNERGHRFDSWPFHR